MPPGMPAMQLESQVDHRAPPALRRWATASVPPAQRFDYWVGAVCECFLEMEVTRAQAHRFEATLESAPLGPIGFNRVRGTELDVYRTRGTIARSRGGSDFYYLLCKADRAWNVEQDGRGARLLPGDAVLIDSRRCYALRFPGSADTLSLELPIAWVDAWLPDAQAQAGRRIDGSTGWGAVLSRFVRELGLEAAMAPPLPAPLLVDQLGGLLALAAGRGAEAPARGQGGRAELRRRVLDAVRERHAEPGLTAAAVARGLGVSERSLHRCLAEGGLAFADALIGCRMQVARRLLADPRFDRLGIAEIGRRVGLADASHFARLCRQRLGATPAALRRQR